MEASTASLHRTDRRTSDWTIAQWFCVLAGVALTLRGAFGLSMTEFGTPSDGWHQVFHATSGVLLLAAHRSPVVAARAAAVFGVVYALFSILGLAGVDGLFGLIEVGAASNVQHGVYAAVALLVWRRAGI